MEHHENCNSKHGGNGFLTGVIVGGLLMYLLTHKQGRKILKELGEAGLSLVENIANFKNLEDIEEEFIEKEAREEKAEAREVGKPPNGKIKRFFKGVKKR